MPGLSVLDCGRCESEVNGLDPKWLARHLARLPTLVNGNRQLCNVESSSGPFVSRLSLSTHQYSSRPTPVAPLAVPLSLQQMTDLSSSDMSSSSDKKMRREASPDEGTFTSQQEFLDSLAPVPLETIEANNRKCGYCWRNYGEANPDQDDAEAPVQFKKCNHVFGEQCMRMLFAIRDPVRVELKPLSFAPGSKGADLGSRLHSYVGHFKILFIFPLT